MPKMSDKMVALRKKEIVSAAEKLFETASFKDITIQDISNETTLTRTAIYTYFQTKEEIFLELLRTEYELWINDLYTIYIEHEAMDRMEFAVTLARSLEKRKNMLKLHSMNHYDMEQNSRVEQLAEFNMSYKRSVDALRNCLDKFCSDMSEEERHEVIICLYPFMYGVYPCVEISEKHEESMHRADVQQYFTSFYDVLFVEIKKLLKL